MLVLQHIGCEPAGAYADELLSRGLQLRGVRLDEGEDLPDWRPYGGILAMGGPMGAYHDTVYPWLGAEKRLIAEAVTAGKPFWGVCLGAQLLAASLGAKVASGPLPEVGMLPVELTDHAARDRVFSAAPSSFPALHWHGDTYELPEGAVQLARSEQYEQQAFVFANAYALQFHLEVDSTLVAEWGHVPAYADSLEPLPQIRGISQLVEQVAQHEPLAIPLARELFGRWLEHVVGLAPALTP
jgi:GMP synthase (glutamine-hydrolysing)